MIPSISTASYLSQLPPALSKARLDRARMQRNLTPEAIGGFSMGPGGDYMVNQVGDIMPAFSNLGPVPGVPGPPTQPTTTTNVNVVPTDVPAPTSGGPAPAPPPVRTSAKAGKSKPKPDRPFQDAYIKQLQEAASKGDRRAKRELRSSADKERRRALREEVQRKREENAEAYKKFRKERESFRPGSPFVGGQGTRPPKFEKPHRNIGLTSPTAATYIRESRPSQLVRDEQLQRDMLAYMARRDQILEARKYGSAPTGVGYQ
jgi:hypothetical protein